MITPSEIKFHLRLLMLPADETTAAARSCAARCLTSWVDQTAEFASKCETFAQERALFCQLIDTALDNNSITIIKESGL